jgi:hypothetical protein
MNNNNVAIFSLILLLASPVGAQGDGDIAREFADLSNNDAAAGQEWFALAGKAREADDLDVATKALERAAELEFSPIRLGMEKARILVAGGNPEKAVGELQTLLDSGFSSVGFVIADPVINSMAGRADYDAVIEKMSALAYPCVHDEAFKEFDFWIGSWDVHVANGTPAGSNVIRRAERGCVLIENWTNTSGGTGMSVNYVDKTTDEWVQIWNAEGGSQINVRGGLTEDGMRMEGHIHSVGNGTTAPFRALWTLLPDGRVRQYFEQSNDDGATWVPWFEGFYTRTD